MTDASSRSRAYEKYPYFEEANSAEVVLARIGENADPRLKAIMDSVIRHLHAAIKEIRPTHEEWLAAIQFLTKTGQMCTDWRQEYILLSDTLGVTMLVDAINNDHGSHATENTILGPFYVMNPPKRELGSNISLDGKGEPIVVHGRVLDEDGHPIAGATVDSWQANSDGFYDVQQKGVQPEMNLRGVFTTNDNGEYWFRSIKPRHYPIPGDGPVGEMMAALGRGVERASHIHFIVSAPGYDTVITHIFRPDCPFLEVDAVFGVKESLIADFRKVVDAKRAAELGFADVPFFWHVEWDFVLAPATGKQTLIHQV
jgi:catechol 1,2-dioxygenase